MNPPPNGTEATACGGTELALPDQVMNSGLPRCVLITPARNEESFLELTIRSVVRQRVRPLRWVLVNDGSTDRTEAIIKEHAAKHAWMELVCRPQRAERHFAGKVDCFRAGYARVQSLEYEVIGNLDGDISFEEDYLEFLLGKFAANPRLGVAGTPFRENGRSYDYRFSSTEHVSGACQLFRRQCFEEIGGYTAVPGGGIDVIAVLQARMKGWQTQAFPEKVCEHHRTMGTAGHRPLVSGFRLGQKDYTLGRHPLWQGFRSVYQMTRPPYVVGGLTLLVGYFWAMLRRQRRPVSRELIEFQRREQMRRLRRFFGWRPAA